MNPLRLVCVCMTALLLAACARPEPPPAPIRAVRTMTVGTSQANVAHDYAAEIRSRSESRLGFRVAGKLLSREVNLGDRVRAGQVLARLDGQDLRLGADAARAGVNAAQVQFDLAMADLRRYRELHQQGFIGAAELDRREAGVRSAQSQLDQAKAQWSVQGNQAAYATLVADAAGVVTAVEAEPGQVLAAGTPVVRMAYDGPRDAVFSVPEDRLPEVKVSAKTTTAFSIAPVMASLRYFKNAATVLSMTLTITSPVLSSASTLRWMKGTPSLTLPASLSLKSDNPS